METESDSQAIIITNVKHRNSKANTSRDEESSTLLNLNEAIAKLTLRGAGEHQAVS